MNTLRSRLNRRQFLAGASGAAGAAILAACGDTTTPTTTAPAPANTAVAPAAATTAPVTGAATSAGGAAMMPAAAATTGTTGATAAPAGMTAAAGMTAGGAMMGKVKSQINAMGIKKGGTLIEGGTADVRTFNPILQGDTTSGLINGLVYNQLLDVDPDTLQPIPALAEKFDTAADGKSYTFTLRKGVKWHDGSPFTADDVKFSYDMYMTPETGSQRAGSLKDRVASIDVKDANTVVFNMKDVVAPFLTTNMYAIISKKAFDGVPPAQFRTAPAAMNPVGTGPFKFKSYKQGDNVTLVGNPDYFKGAPALDTYIYKVVKDSQVLTQQLKTGELDYGAATSADYDDLKKAPNVNVVDYDGFTFTYCGFQLDPAKTTLFQDVKVRQALFYAIDRDTIVKKIRNGLSTVAVGTMPLLSWAYQPEKITNKYPYDTKKAEALLDEAGWKKGADGIRAKDGKKLAFSMWTNSGNKINENYLLVFQDSWKAIGVEMTPKFEEFSVYLDRINKTFDFEMFLVGFSWGVDPDQDTMWNSKSKGGGFNGFSYNNPQVDKLLGDGLRTLDQEKRKAIYLEMQNIVTSEVPAMITDFAKAIYGVNKRVMNRIPNGVAGSDRNYAHLWYVTDGK